MRKFLKTPVDLNGAGILVTGGTGSFGRAYVEYVLRHWKPKRLVIFSRDELKQYEMQMVLRPEDHPSLRYFLGDVRDVDRLVMAMRGIDTVIHAAALKHVPAAEYNPFECIRTNVIGAENIVQASIRSGVKKVVALSTDKAANPVNLYGASKLAADKIFVAANQLSGADGTKFAVVRYGNVLGSRGSVVPFFRDLIASGAKTIPITDPRMTRFWIMLEQGIEFVVSSADMMKGGEIFIPKIPSMKVTDVATALGPDLEQKVVGIRPGEKIHEVLVTEDDARWTVENDDRFIILPPFAKASLQSNSRVGDGFRYASDNNTEWLSVKQFQELMAASAK